MKRRKQGRAVNGWLVVDKPAGLTSAQVVSRVRRALDARKAGHGGTLDPLATGILPIALGEATKTVSYVMDGSKGYRFTLRWGQATNTDDAEGKVTEESRHRPAPEEIEAVLPRFQGEIDQVPPAFSAIKINGQRAYDLARAGQTPVLEARPIWIERIALVPGTDPDHATFEVVCGKGAFMRALARDIARALGTLGHITALRRTGVGPFSEDNAISLESLESLGHIAAASGYLHPVEAALDGIPALDLTETEVSSLRCGQAISLLARIYRERVRDLENGTIVCAKSAGKAVALARYQDGGLHPVRLLNT